MKYFNDDTLAANVFYNKYCLKGQRSMALELTPDDTQGLASEFARVEKKFSGVELYQYDKIYSYLKTLNI